MPSNDPSLSDDQQRCLIETATQSIDHGIESGRPLAVDATKYTDPLRATCASFVTLQIENALRGCIGSLEANRSLINDVAENAFSAAFRDPRFNPVSRSEFLQLEIHISVLSSPEPIEFTDERDLLTRIRPGVDGLILEVNGRRGTFLPSVWDSIPDTSSFLRHLKQKAGLPENFWSDDLSVWRYTTRTITSNSNRPGA